MKDKTITVSHYDYVNDLTKILGFKNLSDFETSISYENLKNNEKTICTEFNKTINVFKKLFSQEGFDLRKINYEFKNIDQIIGFYKKVLTYLSIGFNYSRKKGINELRLIQQNNIYNNYIMNLRNIPQKEDLIIKFAKTTELATTMNETIGLVDLIDKFKKNDIKKKIRTQNFINLKIFQLDWIKDINVKLLIKNDKIIELPIGTKICLVIQEEEMILSCIDELNKDTQNLLINFPVNFNYLNNVCLKIILPNDMDNMNNNCYNNYDYEIEINGFNITNYDEMRNEYKFDKKKILFNHNDLYRNLNIEINNQIIYFNNDNIKLDLNPKPNSSFFSMKYVMNYLNSKSFEKKYIISNSLFMTTLKNFDYFKWIKIRTTNGDKMESNTLVNLVVGGTIILEYIINDKTFFDNDNYFKFDIDLPNNILYRYHEIKIMLRNSNNDIKEYEIIVCGNVFKKTTPKVILNSNIIYDHDVKWYDLIKSKKFVSIRGMFYNMSQKITIDTKDDILIEMFKKLKSLEKVSIHNVEYENKLLASCIFVDFNFDNYKEITTNKIYDFNPLLFIAGDKFKKYLIDNDLIKTQEFCFGAIIPINNNDNNLYNICEITNKSTYKLSYIIQRNADLLKYLDIEFYKIINNDYIINCWLELDTKIMYDFGKINLNNRQKIRLDMPNNKCVNLITLQNNLLCLVIEIPIEKLNYWKENVNLSCGSIYCETGMRRFLATIDYTYDFNKLELSMS